MEKLVLYHAGQIIQVFLTSNEFHFDGIQFAIEEEAGYFELAIAQVGYKLGGAMVICPAQTILPRPYHFCARTSEGRYLGFEVGILRLEAVPESRIGTMTIQALLNDGEVLECEREVKIELFNK